MSTQSQHLYRVFKPTPKTPAHAQKTAAAALPPSNAAAAAAAANVEALATGDPFPPSPAETTTLAVVEPPITEPPPLVVAETPEQALERKSRRIAALRESVERDNTIRRHLQAALDMCNEERKHMSALPPLPPRSLSEIAAMHERLNASISASLELAKEIKWRAHIAVSDAETQGSATFASLLRTVVLPGGGGGGAGTSPIVHEAVREVLNSILPKGATTAAEITIALTRDTISKLSLPARREHGLTAAQRVFLLRMFATDAEGFYSGLVQILTGRLEGPAQTETIARLRTEEVTSMLHRSILWVGGDPPHAAVHDIHQVLQGSPMTRPSNLTVALLLLLQLPVPRTVTDKGPATAIADAFRPDRNRSTGSPPTISQVSAMTDALVAYFGMDAFRDFARLCFAETPHMTTSGGGGGKSTDIMELWAEVGRNRDDPDQTLWYSVITTAAYLTGVYLLCPPSDGDYSAFGLDYGFRVPAAAAVPDPTAVFAVITRQSPMRLWAAICGPLGRSGLVDRLTEEQWCNLIRTTAIYGA